MVDRYMERFETYLSVLTIKYESAGKVERENIVKGLEEFVGNILNGRSTRARLPTPFNPKEARAVRLAAGVGATELGRELGTTASNIWMYEKKGIVSATAVRNKGGVKRKYLLWLKGQGYNPFNLP